MRKFICTECGHKFEVDSCNGQRGWQISCPQCNSAVRRVNPNSGQGLGTPYSRFGRRGQNSNWCTGQRGRKTKTGRGRGQGFGKERGFWFGTGNKPDQTQNVSAD